MTDPQSPGRGAGLLGSTQQLEIGGVPELRPVVAPAAHNKIAEFRHRHGARCDAEIPDVLRRLVYKPNLLLLDCWVDTNNNSLG